MLENRTVRARRSRSDGAAVSPPPENGARTAGDAMARPTFLLASSPATSAGVASLSQLGREARAGRGRAKTSFERAAADRPRGTPGAGSIE